MNEEDSFILPEISVEQQEIINNIKIKNNVIVDAIAGSGKTTSICHLAEQLSNKQILLLTYNKRLKYETAKTINKCNITNVQVSNFHSFCHAKYLVGGNTDQMILDALYDHEESEDIKFNYDIIVIDEAQDLTELYVRLIKMIISHNKSPPIMCIIGDIRQTIYTFNGADSRFLTFANKIFITKTDIWVILKLSTSYRLSNAVAKFINKCVFKEDIIVPNGDIGVKPRYIFCDAFGTAPINELIGHYLVKFGYTYSDIFVLAPSIQSDLSPVKMLANALSTIHNIPVFIPTSDSEKLDSQITANKIIFASLHQVKGLQRKCVLLFGFDNSYYYYYNNDGTRETCPNEIYVGLTRCSERLTIFHHYRKDFINFLDVESIPECCYVNKIGGTNLNVDYFQRKGVNINLRLFDTINVRNKEETAIRFILDYNNINESLDKPIKISVTRLLSHLPIHVINKALSFVTVTQIKNVAINTGIKNPFDSDEEDDCLNLKAKLDETEVIKNDNFVVSVFLNETIKENVSEIIGTAIPIFYEYVKFGSLPILSWIENDLSGKPYNNNSVYKNIKKRYQRIKGLKSIKGADLFELVTIYLGLQNNVIHKVNQISNFKLMNMTNLNKCIKRISNHITIGSIKPRFEVYMETPISLKLVGYDSPIKRILNGFVDCIDKTTLWEFKTVQNIQTVHLLQLAVYAFLFYSGMEIGKKFKLLNINDGLKYEISGTVKSFTKLVHYIYKFKFDKPIPITDEEFINTYKKN